jgi:AraC-like DNA-binding protein
MVLYIKNMVSLSCKMAVKFEIEKIGLHCIYVESGEVQTWEDLSDEQLSKLKTALQKAGYELVNNKKNILVEKIKSAIAESVRHPNEPVKTKFSDYLSGKLNCSYRYLAKKFLETQGTTIEKHVISYKIERVKEMLLYDGLSLSEIAFRLNYSSVAHLSSQFKKVTGFTPSDFKEAGSRKAG